MTAPNVEELLQVNGYHGGTVRVRDRQVVADYVLELQQENDSLKRLLIRQLFENARMREREKRACS